MSCVTPLRIGASGLSLREELLLQSMVRLAPAGRWTYVSDLPCEVRLCSVGELRAVGREVNPPLPVAVLRAGEPPPAQGLSLHLPLRTPAVLDLLERLQQRLTTPSTAVLGRVADTAPAAPAAVPVDHGAGRALQFAQLIRQALAQERDVIEVAVPGRHPALVLECWRRQFLLPDERRPPLSADAWLKPVGELIAHCEVRRNGSARTVWQANAAPRRSLDRLLWGLGMLTRGPMLLEHMPQDAAYQLRRWPDFGALGTPPRFIKLAAWMVRQPMTVDGMTRQGQLSRAEVVSFFNACELCGLFKPHEVVRASAMAGSSPSALAAPRAGMRGLLSRIRSALHLG